MQILGISQGQTLETMDINNVHQRLRHGCLYFQTIAMKRRPGSVMLRYRGSERAQAAEKIFKEYSTGCQCEYQEGRLTVRGLTQSGRVSRSLSRCFEIFN
jgi:hypothetical protein